MASTWLSPLAVPRRLIAGVPLSRVLFAGVLAAEQLDHLGFVRHQAPEEVALVDDAAASIAKRYFLHIAKSKTKTRDGSIRT